MIDMIQFSNMIPAEQLSKIFKDFFDEHIAAYGVLQDVQFGGINVITNDKSSIMYSVKLLDDEDKDMLARRLNKLVLSLYGHIYTPTVYINNDILCITITKE